MKKRSLFFIVFSIHALAISKEQDLNNYRFELKHKEREGVGYNDGYSTLEFFYAPPSESKVHPLLDARIHVFNNGKFASNLGIGLRIPSHRKKVIFGGNIYYDYRDARNMYINQFGAGIELLSRQIDVRFNAYFPIGRRGSLGKIKEDGFKKHNFLFKRRLSRSLTSWNFELGKEFRDLVKSIDLYIGIGPYYLNHQKTGGRFFGGALGGKGRLSLKLNDGITFGMEATRDRIFKWKVQGYVSLSFPFGPGNMRKKGHRLKKIKKGRYLSRLRQNVERNEIIPIQSKTDRFPLINPATGQPYFFIFVNNLSSSLGTFESPYPTTLQAQNNSSPFDVIYVFTGDGTTTGYDTGMLLKTGQIFQGSGFPLELSGVTIPPLTPGTSPTITNTTGVGVTLADDVLVEGFIISGAMGSGILADSVGSFTIQNNTIDTTSVLGPNGDGINLNDLTGNNTINSNTFVSNAQSGIDVENLNASTLTISNNTFTTNGAVAIAFGTGGTGSDNTINISNNTFTNNLAGSFFTTGFDDSTFNLTNNLIALTLANTITPVSFSSGDGNIVNFTGNIMTDLGTGVAQAAAGLSIPVAFTTGTILIDSNTFTLESPAPISNAILSGSTTVSNNSVTTTPNLFLFSPITDLNLVGGHDAIFNCTDNVVIRPATGFGISSIRLGAGRMQYDVSRNTVTAADNLLGIFFFTTTLTTVCAEVNDNVAPEYDFLAGTSAFRLSSNTGDVTTSNTATTTTGVPFDLTGTITQVGPNPGPCPP